MLSVEIYLHPETFDKTAEKIKNIGLMAFQEHKHANVITGRVKSEHQFSRIQKLNGVKLIQYSIVAAMKRIKENK